MTKNFASNFVFKGNGIDLEAYKEEISKWKQMVSQLGIQNDPEIKKMEAELDALWEQLGLDNVDVPARQMVVRRHNVLSKK